MDRFLKFGFSCCRFSASIQDVRTNNNFGGQDVCATAPGGNFSIGQNNFVTDQNVLRYDRRNSEFQPLKTMRYQDIITIEPGKRGGKPYI